MEETTMKEATVQATKDVVSEAASTLVKGGVRKMVGHALGEILEVGIGAAASYSGARVAKQMEMRAAQAHVQKLRDEGKHEEAHSFMNKVLAAWTQEDEATEFRSLSRAVKHFNQTNQSDKADQLLATFVGLNASGLDRLGEILLNCGDEDAQFRYLVNWGEASANQQKQMLLITRLEVPLEHQPGHVFATGIRRVLLGQRDKSNAHVAEILQGIRDRRAARKEKAESKH